MGVTYLNSKEAQKFKEPKGEERRRGEEGRGGEMRRERMEGGRRGG